MNDDNTVLDLFLELQRLDRVPRLGYSLRGIADPESVSEHSFHLVFMVWALAHDEPAVDTLRAIELALVHDLAETRTGDLPKTVAHHLPAGAKAAMEHGVATELLAPLGTAALERFDEYQARTTTEAQFVKACDELHVRIKALLYTNAGARGLDDFWNGFENFVAELPFVCLRRLGERLAAERPSG